MPVHALGDSLRFPRLQDENEKHVTAARGGEQCLQFGPPGRVGFAGVRRAGSSVRFCEVDGHSYVLDVSRWASGTA